ncbi:MAG: hypothetical protein V9G10_14110 [Candidatus Nanopelagicales bacterium]
MNALFADQLDISYIGPNPTISAYTQSKGEAIKVISGAASGGAALVVSKDINSRRGPQGQDAGHAAAGQHPGRGPALLAQGAGADRDHRGRRRRVDQAAGQRRRSHRFLDRPDTGRLGARAVGE